jgi:hypothetical protein
MRGGEKQMSMNLHLTEGEEGLEINLWQTPTHITDLCLSYDKNGTPDGGMAGVMRRRRRIHKDTSIRRKETRMTADLEALAHRAVSCKDWRWMPGMLLMGGTRVLSVLTDLPRDYPPPYGYASYMGGPVFIVDLRVAKPNFEDPATLGCLLALVRDAWGDPAFYTRQGDTRLKGTDNIGWDFFGHLHGKSCKGALYNSEAEALIAALEAV